MLLVVDMRLRRSLDAIPVDASRRDSPSAMLSRALSASPLDVWNLKVQHYFTSFHLSSEFGVAFRCGLLERGWRRPSEPEEAELVLLSSDLVQGG